MSVYARHETLWGYEIVSAAYREGQEKSGHRIMDWVRELYPDTDEKKIRKVCG